jgi:hypothetical protein
MALPEGVNDEKGHPYRYRHLSGNRFSAVNHTADNILDTQAAFYPGSGNRNCRGNRPEIPGAENPPENKITGTICRLS